MVLRVHKLYEQSMTTWFVPIVSDIILSIVVFVISRIFIRP